MERERWPQPFKAPSDMGSSLGDSPDNDGNVIPEGRLIGQDAKGEQLTAWIPLHLEAGYTSEQLFVLEQRENVNPLDPRMKSYIARLPKQATTQDVSTCIVTLEQLGHTRSPSAEELADPKLIENWSKQFLEGYEFEQLPQSAILQGVIQGGSLPKDVYGRKRGVYTLGNGSGHILYATREADNKITIWMRNNNREYRWNTWDSVLLGVRKIANK